MRGITGLCDGNGMERHFLSEKKPEMLPFLGRYFRGMRMAQSGSCAAISVRHGQNRFQIESFGLQIEPQLLALPCTNQGPVLQRRCTSMTFPLIVFAAGSIALAAMGLGPVAEIAQRRNQAATHGSEPVFDARRNDGENLARDQAIALHAAERLREDLRGDFRKRTLQLAGAQGAGLEQMQDGNSPFVGKQFDGVAGLQDPGPHGLFGHTYLQVCTYLEVPRSLERSTATK